MTISTTPSYNHFVIVIVGLMGLVQSQNQEEKYLSPTKICTVFCLPPSIASKKITRTIEGRDTITMTMEGRDTITMEGRDTIGS